MTLPEAPTNVRIVTADGVEHSVEVTYRGLDERGQHLWVATTRWVGTPAGMHIDTLPPRTAVSIEFTP